MGCCWGGRPQTDPHARYGVASSLSDDTTQANQRSDKKKKKRIPEKAPPPPPSYPQGKTPLIFEEA